jgi:hypothetical protein
VLRTSNIASEKVGDLLRPFRPIAESHVIDGSSKEIESLDFDWAPTMRRNYNGWDSGSFVFFVHKIKILCNLSIMPAVSHDPYNRESQMAT